MNTSIISLLHITDPTLPIGGYTQSHGLETYVQAGIVKDKVSAAMFVQQVLENSVQFNDASFVKLAFEATQENDILKLVALDEECNALKSPREIREASQKLGLRFMKIFKRVQQNPSILPFEKAVLSGETTGHYSIVFGMYAQKMGHNLEETLYAYYYNTAMGYITNAVNLIPLGQLEGQDILFDLYPFFESLVKSTMILDRDFVGLCSIGLDIRCMQHENLYSRLYMS